MAKDRKKLIHIHSSIPDKQPTPQSLEVGEIAVNNHANQEFLSIKNSEDKVKRFSSDEQMITWMEKKEVIPYEGQVRGEVGPTGTKDDKGSYGITNDDLLQNKSNIIIKINQVAASATTKHDVVNGAKDIYENFVNPAISGGVIDGAGFAIDMSRYAMIGANPSFSSITVTDKSDLSGNTTIANGDGTGTRNGHTLAIKTTDVTANDTNWTETITNKKSTVTAEEDKIGTLNESATTRTTVVGTENLTVSGTTTEVHTGNVTITNSANVTATTNGTTTETKVGNVIENNSANKQENTTGTHKLYTTGDTCINSQENANFYGKGSTNIGVACDGTKGSATTVYGTTTTISGNTTNVTGATTLNLSGNTINERALTANTNVTSAYTSATTATTVIGTANTSATTATLSGNTLDITEATRLSAKTPSTYVSGTSLSVVETNTDIESCGRISGKTNAFTIQECATGSGKTVINQTDIKASGKTLSFDETTSISAKTPSTTLSGTNLSISETNTTINSCGKIEVTTDSYSLKQCGTAGTISITAQTQNINGGNLTVNESGNTAINTNGTTNIKSTGSTTIETNGANNKVTIQSSGNGGDVEVFAKDTLCMSGGSTAAMVGTTKTNIGKNCSDTGQTATLNLNGTTINETGTTVNISGSTAANVSGATVVVSGNTTNISGTTNLNMSGKTVNVDATDIDVDASNNYCVSAATNANFYGKTTNVGVDCGGTTATTINVSGTTINEGGTTNNNNFTTINNTATTINNKANFNITGTTYISGNTTISGDTTIGGNLTIPITCSTITSSTVNDALCEILDRGEVSWKVGDYATTDENLKWYELWQNGAQIKDQNGNAVRIDIPKDHILKDVSIVYGKANGSSFTACTSTATDCHWYIKLVWNVFNPSTGHSNDKTVYLPVDDFVHDIDDDNSKTDRGVNVDVWYDGKQNWVSADTTVKIITDGNGTKTFAKSAGEHSLNSYKLTLTHNGLKNSEFDPFKSSSTITLPHSALSIDYGVVVTGKTDDSYDTSAAKTVSIPTAVSHMTRGKLTVKHNGLEGEFDPATDKTLTLPHSALSIDYGANVTGRTDDSYDTSAAKTVYIPTSVKNLSNWNGSCYEFDAPLCVTGTITASGAIYSSDRNLKENIMNVSREEINKANNVLAKSFNFKSDESKRKVYGVIAQDVQEAGLDELVHTDDNGNLGVDYTSLLLLKIAYLEDLCGQMYGRIIKLEDKLNDK